MSSTSASRPSGARSRRRAEGQLGRCEEFTKGWGLTTPALLMLAEFPRNWVHRKLVSEKTTPLGFSVNRSNLACYYPDT